MNKMCLLLCLFLTININAFDDALLIEHVKNSIQNGYAHKSKLTNSILALNGMSSSKVRHFLNNICSLPNASYLEIGVWYGSTFISALYGNTATLSKAIAIDNWSEFGGTAYQFLANTSQYFPRNSFIFYEQDSFLFNVKNIPDNSINIYFYDGNHTAQSQKSAFTHYNSAFSGTFIAIVDDWNWAPAREGTQQAFAELGYTILFEQVLPADYNGDLNNWWNGLYVAVIKK